MKTVWGKQDVRIPADPADFETTESRSALPPVQFSVALDGALGTTLFTIQDRQYPAQRAPTVSYRIYFLPAAFAPKSVDTAFIRRSGSRVASLVTEVQAPGRGTALTATDYQFLGQPGWYFCVGVSRRGLEAPPEHVVAAP
jgi:hypothetical protein